MGKNHRTKFVGMDVHEKQFVLRQAATIWTDGLSKLAISSLAVSMSLIG